MDVDNLILQQTEILTNALLPNPDAHKSRQLLSKISSDDEIVEDDDDEEEEDLENEIVQFQLEANDEENDETEEKTHLKNSDFLPTNSSIEIELESSSKQVNRPSSSLNNFLDEKMFLFIKTFESSQSSNDVPSKLPEKLIHSNSVPTHHRKFSSHSFHQKANCDTQLDFNFETSSTKIIFDRSENYEKVQEILRDNWISFETPRLYDDLWSFCLKSRTLHFYSIVNFQKESQNDPKAVPPTIRLNIQRIFHGERKFWMLFERRPTFVDPMLNCDIEELNSIENRRIWSRIDVPRSINAKFSYGALTSMRTFFYHPWFRYESHQTDWKVNRTIKIFV